MHCGSCVAKARAALQKVDGVLSADVRLADSSARISYDSRRTHVNAMAAALTEAGYATVVEGTTESPAAAGRDSSKWLTKAILLGAAAATAVIIFYLGLITLTSDWSYAVYQFSENWGWVVALAVGLSFQVGLFTRMRTAMTSGYAKGAGKGLAASGGMSGVAMALCCSHYLATLLPAIGLPFLSGAVAGLAQYQTPFFAVGVLSNLLGIAYMIRLMSKNGLLDFRFA
jgi:copper chaperone CopZ